MALLQVRDFPTAIYTLLMEVLHEAARLNISCYDMFYFVLARHNAATLITCDQKLKTLAIDNGISVE